MHNCYMVRARTNEIFDDIFVKNSVVGVGWSEVDFAAQATPAAVHNDVYNVYYANQGFDPRMVGRWCNAAERFKSIQADDVIIVPRPAAIAIATALSDEIYNAAYVHTYDAANLHKVKYKSNARGDILLIPRSSLSHGLQSRLRMPGSIVVDLGEFANEIDYVLKYNENAYTQAFNELVIKRNRDAHEELLRNIQTGKTQLEGGGAGYEKLIVAIFKALGYKAEILPKTRFPNGDADIEAVYTDPIFGETNILIQVKHNSGITGAHGIQQLIGALQSQDYTGYMGVFVTSAENVDDNAMKLAEKHNITVLKGADVVNLIFGNYGKLQAIAPDILVELGLFNTTQIFRF